MCDRLEELFPKFYSLFYSFIPNGFTYNPKTATYYSQCDYLNMENTTVLELP